VSLGGQSIIRLASPSDGDRKALGTWLARPEIRSWWGSAERAEAEVALAMSDPTAICRMIAADSRPIGYGQAMNAVCLDDSVRDGLEAGTWECALFIASDEHRNQGLGTAALEALVSEVFSTTMAIACAIRIPVRSERVVRDVETAGFRWRRVVGDALLGPSWILVRNRPALR
jgi:aminoglycoside 6'-N-acetyltransferase